MVLDETIQDDRIQGVHLLDPGQCLVTWLRNQFPPSLDFESTWVVLPTTRLAGSLNASLLAGRISSGTGQDQSQHHAHHHVSVSMISPRTMNLDGFLGSAEAWVPSAMNPGANPPRALGADMPEAIFNALIKKSRLKHIDPGHAHELAHLTGVAVDNMLPLDTLGKSVTRILDDEIFHSEEHISALRERIESVDATVRAFLDFLTRNHLETMEMRRARLATSIADSLEKPSGTVQVPWRQLIIAGFTSMVPAHMRMLRALAGRRDVTVVLTRPLDGTSPMARLARALTPSLPPVATEPAGARISTWIARNRQEETRLAFDIAASLAPRDASPPASVAILVPDEKTYEPWIRQEIQTRFGTRPDSGVNVAAPRPLTQTLIGSWFLHLAQFARLRADECLEETRQRAAAFLTHPYQWHRTGAETRHAVTACLAAAVAASPDVRSIPRGLSVTKNTDSSTIAAASTVVDRSFALGRALRQSSCLDTFEAELSRFDGSITNGKDPERDAREALRKVIRDLRFVHQRIPCAADTILELFVQRVQAAMIRDRGEPLTGLQVLTLAEARHVPFHSAVIVGCNEGVFPRSLPKDRLLDQFILRKLGLPTWEDLEAIEDTTFHLLQARLANLVMTCAQQDASRPLVPSRYIELSKTIRGVKPRLFKEQPRQTASAKPGASLNPLAPPRAQAPVSGRIMTPHSHSGDAQTALSASTLASLISCPYKYALDRQAAGPAADYESDAMPRRGNWLHDAIKSALSAHTPSGEWKNDLAGLNRLLVESARSSAPPEIRDTGILAHLESWTWPRLARFTANNWTAAPGGVPAAAQSESRFEVELGNRRFKGSIDRFEDLGGIWILLDYKATKAPTRTQIRNGTRPQLAVYAHAIARNFGLPLERCVAGHFELLEGKWVLGFAGEETKEAAIAMGLRGPRSHSIPTPGEAIAAAVDRMAWRTANVTGSGPGGSTPDIPAYFPDKTECGFCPHRSICRRDDAATASWFNVPALSKSLGAHLGILPGNKADRGGKKS